MDIGFYFEFNNTVIQLPYNPEKITVKRDGSNKTEEVLSLGEINILKDSKLREISFESFFPYAPWLPGTKIYDEFQQPQFYRDFFDNIVDLKKPVRFIVTDPVNISMLVSIENFEFKHQAGDHEDAYYSLELKEYRNHQIVKIDPNTGLTLLTDNAGARASRRMVLTPSELTVETLVYLTGIPTWYSDGQGPLYEYNRYPCKVNYIEKGAKYPYSLFDPAQGKIIGWATAEMLVIQ